MYECWIFFSSHTQNGQLADCEEIFAEFYKKCIGLELQTTPLSLYYSIVEVLVALDIMGTWTQGPYTCTEGGR